MAMDALLQARKLESERFILFRYAGTPRDNPKTSFFLGQSPSTFTSPFTHKFCYRAGI